MTGQLAESPPDIIGRAPGRLTRPSDVLGRIGVAGMVVVVLLGVLGVATTLFFAAVERPWDGPSAAATWVLPAFTLCTAGLVVAALLLWRSGRIAAGHLQAGNQEHRHRDAGEGCDAHCEGKTKGQ